MGSVMGVGPLSFCLGSAAATDWADRPPSLRYWLRLFWLRGHRADAAKEQKHDEQIATHALQFDEFSDADDVAAVHKTRGADRGFRWYAND